MGVGVGETVQTKKIPSPIGRSWGVDIPLPTSKNNMLSMLSPSKFIQTYLIVVLQHPGYSNVISVSELWNLQIIQETLVRARNQSVKM